MKPYPLWIILLFACGTAAAQSSPSETGIYLTIKCTRNMPRQTVVLTGRSVCLASSPIIVPSDFESIGEVATVRNLVFFELTLRSKARERLAMLTANLPGSGLALVVDKEVFFVFKSDELKGGRTLRFQGPTEQTAAFHRVHDSLTETLVAN